MGVLGFLTGVSLVTRLVRIALLLVTAVVVYLVVTLVQVLLTARDFSPRHADAIVVLGSSYEQGRPTPDLAARLDEAVNLYRAGFAPEVVVTASGSIPSGSFDTSVSVAYLRQHGVPGSAIVAVGGTSTWGNLGAASQALLPAGHSTVLVVTDPFHEDRSMAVASDVGLHPVPTPTQTSPIAGWHLVAPVAKETVAVGLGRIVGYEYLHRLDPFGG